jgi:hypothetical protein
MVMQKYKKIVLLLSILFLSFSTILCSGDPWPEPDTMEDPTGKDTDVSGNDGDADADSDTDADGDTDTDADTDIGIGDKDGGADWGTDDADTDTDSHTDSDTDDITHSDSDSDNEDMDKEDEYNHLKNHVFLSAISEDGRVTVAGLAGAIPEGRTAQCFVNGDAYKILPGVERGFALRVSAEAEADINIVVKNSGGAVVSVLSVDATAAETLSARDDFIGDADGATSWNSSYISVFGAGEMLKADHLIIGADITRSSAAAVPVLCAENTCMFELLLYGKLGDDAELFQVPASSNQGGAPAALP